MTTFDPKVVEIASRKPVDNGGLPPEDQDMSTITREELNAHLKAMHEENMRLAVETRSEIRIGLAELNASFSNSSKEQFKSYVTLSLSIAAAVVAILGFMINFSNKEPKSPPSQPIVITVPNSAASTPTSQAPQSPELPAQK